MSDRLLVSTRKGLFIAQRQTRDNWTPGTPHFLGDPVTMTLYDTRDATANGQGTLYAALNLGHFGVKLRRSTDDGANWEEIAVPAYPKPENAPADAKLPALVQIWSLETGGADQPGTLWAGTIPGGLFRSDDRGASWTLIDSLWSHPKRAEWGGGGYDEAGIHSICVDPRDSRRIAIAISSGGVWKTTDGGTTWNPASQGMYAEYMPPELRFDENSQDPHRMVRCPTAPDVLWVQHHNGVFRSTDDSANWNDVTAIQPAKFGFAVAVHPEDPDTAWFVPAIKDERRIPVDGKLVVARTRDGGKSFDVLRNGLPQENAYDLVYRHGLAVDASGERLAFGSTTGGLWVSENQGDAWACVSAHLPPIYSVQFI